MDSFCNRIRLASMLSDCSSRRDANDSPMLDRISMEQDGLQMETNNQFGSDRSTALLEDVRRDDENRDASNSSIENDDNPSMDNVLDGTREDSDVAAAVDLP